LETTNERLVAPASTVKLKLLLVPGLLFPVNDWAWLETVINPARIESININWFFIKKEVHASVKNTFNQERTQGKSTGILPAALPSMRYILPSIEKLVNA
jgi:hypothetical protein